MNVRYPTEFMTDWKKKLHSDNKDGIEKLLGMLGLAMRAGRVIIGTEQICSSLSKSGGTKPALVLIAEGASANARKKLENKCAFYGVQIIDLPIEMQRLGKLLGKTYAPVAAAVTDEGFAHRLKRLAEMRI